MATVDYETRENAQAAELGRRLEPIAAALSAASGQQWAVSAGSYWHATLVSGPYALGVGYNSHKQRLSFTGRWPTDNSGQRHGPNGYSERDREMSVAADRPADKIAAEVWRRLGQWYIGRYDAAQQAADAATDSQRRRQTIADRLAAILGTQAADCNDRPSTRFSCYRHCIRSVEVYSENTVKIETNGGVPVDIAAQFLALLVESGADE